MALGITVIMTLCLSGCYVCAINKVNKNQQFVENYNDSHQPNATSAYAIAN